MKNIKSQIKCFFSHTIHLVAMGRCHGNNNWLPCSYLLVLIHIYMYYICLPNVIKRTGLITLELSAVYQSIKIYYPRSPGRRGLS